MLDKATIDYIINYYSRFMTLTEAAATKHHMTSYKFRETLSKDASGDKADFLRQKNGFQITKDALNLLEGGYENFQTKTAERIFFIRRSVSWDTNHGGRGTFARHTKPTHKSQLCKRACLVHSLPGHTLLRWIRTFNSKH